MVIWRSPLPPNGYSVPLVDPTTWRLKMRACVTADGATCNARTNNNKPLPNIPQ